MTLNNKYAVKVWLTSIVLGLILFYVYQWVKSLQTDTSFVNDQATIILFVAISIFSSFGFGLPSLLFFSISCNVVPKFIVNPYQVRVALFVLSQLFCWASFMIVFSLDPGSLAENIRLNLDIILPFSIGLAIAFFVIKNGQYQSIVERSRSGAPNYWN